MTRPDSEVPFTADYSAGGEQSSERPLTTEQKVGLIVAKVMVQTVEKGFQD